MKPAARLLLIVTVLIQWSAVIGCGSKEEKASPQQTEELRQQALQRGQSFSKEK
jgi:hypothetical protein